MRVFRQRRSRPISEALAYARCHGDRSPNMVRVVRLEPRRSGYPDVLSGETLRMAFEAKLAERAS